MKKILVLFLSVILALFMVAAAGCNTANEYVDRSLKYNVDTNSKYQDTIDGSFKIKVNSGIVVNVKFTVNGFDEHGNKLWSKNFDKYYRGFEPDDEPYEISFSSTYWYDDYGPARTSYVTVSNIEIKKESTNEWMGWTFGTISAVATVAVVVLFVLSKLKSTKETAFNEDDKIA